MRWSPGCQCCGGVGPTDCCSIYTPATVTVSGLTNCFSVYNGTYSLSLNASLPPSGCVYEHQTINSAPGTPCSGACETAADSGTGETYHFYPSDVLVYVVPINTTGGAFEISCSLYVSVRAYRSDGVYCISVPKYTQEFLYERYTCGNGTFTNVSDTTYSGGSGSTPPDPTWSSIPTVSVAS